MPSSLATPDWHSSPLDPVEHRRQQQQQQQQRRHRRLQQQQQQQQQQPQRRDDYFRFDDSTVVKWWNDPQMPTRHDKETTTPTNRWKPSGNYSMKKWKSVQFYTDISVVGRCRMQVEVTRFEERPISTKLFLFFHHSRSRYAVLLIFRSGVARRSLSMPFLIDRVDARRSQWKIHFVSFFFQPHRVLCWSDMESTSGNYLYRLLEGIDNGIRSEIGFFSNRSVHQRRPLLLGFPIDGSRPQGVQGCHFRRKWQLGSFQILFLGHGSLTWHQSKTSSTLRVPNWWVTTPGGPVLPFCGENGNSALLSLLGNGSLT